MFFISIALFFIYGIIKNMKSIDITKNKKMDPKKTSSSSSSDVSRPTENSQSIPFWPMAILVILAIVIAGFVWYYREDVQQPARITTNGQAQNVVQTVNGDSSLNISLSRDIISNGVHDLSNTFFNSETQADTIFKDSFGIAEIDMGQGGITVTANLPNPKSYNRENWVYEVWLVDYANDQELSSETEKRDFRGISHPLFKDTGFMLSLGIMTASSNNDENVQDHFIERTSTNYDFIPYDEIVITLEPDGTGRANTDFDPRPNPVIAISGMIDIPNASRIFESAQESIDTSAARGFAGDIITLGSGIGNGRGVEPITVADGIFQSEQNAKQTFQGSEGTVSLNNDQDSVSVQAYLPDPASIDYRSWKYEVWLVDDEPSQEDSSETGKRSFAGLSHPDFKDKPYMISIGLLESTGELKEGLKKYELHYLAQHYDFTPFDRVVVTMEPKGTVSGTDYDPRPQPIQPLSGQR